MSDLTDDGQRLIADLARRHGLATGAVEQMARAVAAGGGGMAQFNIPDLGGPGQWMAGGMTMVGDMFNRGLAASVANLCADLAAAMAATPLFAAAPGGTWWPSELGSPAATGGQNQVRYAHFPDARRIAVDDGVGVRVLDTADHQIGGFGQQQSGPGDPFLGISFSSQYGQFALASLPLAPADPAPAAPSAAEPTRAPGSFQSAEAPALPNPWGEPPAPHNSPAPGRRDGDDILATIERLAALRDAGALTDAEFTAKKTDLLARL